MSQHPPMPNRVPYPSDLTDQQWALIENLVPEPVEYPNLQEPVYPRREIVNGILFRLRTGCAWRHLPHDLPPWQSVYHYFYIWRKSPLLDNMLDRLRTAAPAIEGSSPTPTLAMIDSQNAETAEGTTRADRGFDAGKNGERKKAPHSG